ncbi:DUF1150 domain-containing protein [Ancylobacter mangrovi]|uniref:DUF1150 domain-containing protein n=1 Tax=Ancylobacter mangrovi TaxID=2972472 RepID=A0A9X2T6L8_9HYPH|nr:DUF1150 domain-containing protein [Ancylobacter mangrovi]MCS0495098.1 DUF1150 domain-containing protein [Ancylobacter mangrovi]MCS0502492.1 DUF1150 domain-containing protein [Ancylobacter mangrovi]
MTNEFEINSPDAGSAVAGALSPEAFANLGGGHIAYVRAIDSQMAAELFPQARLAPGLKLFTLHAADGTPMMLTDSREAAVASAMQNELVTLSVH